MKVGFKTIYFVRDKILGRVFFSYLQEKAKLLFTFHSLYSFRGKKSSFSKKTYVFMIDGRTVHGGLSDRLRGLFSVYKYCKENGANFKVCWTYPFLLQDYLNPKYDWLTTSAELSYNLNNTRFCFCNSYCKLNNDTVSYFQRLKSKKIENHVYSNVTICESEYQDIFNELFSLDSRLEKSVQSCMTALGGCKYISITFRFIGLLGDFNDDPRWGACSPEEQRVYISKCIGAIKILHRENSEFKILVTADSPTFLSEAQKLSYVYVIPGKLTHMDNTDDNNYKLHEKAFVDLIMISRAERCYSYRTGKMFGDSKFARTAALIGGKEVIDLVED